MFGGASGARAVCRDPSPAPASPVAAGDHGFVNQLPGNLEHIT